MLPDIRLRRGSGERGSEVARVKRRPSRSPEGKGTGAFFPQSNAVGFSDAR